MARPTKRRVPPGRGRGPGGRVTPKGSAAAHRTTSDRQAPDASGRYTPPIPRDVKVSPRWVPVLLFIFLALGLVVIIGNYLSLLPGLDAEESSNAYLLVGLGFILAGIITATQYH